MESRLNEEYSITIATPKDTREIFQLIVAVADWLKAQEENQWETVRNGEDDDEILEAIARKRVYVVRKQHEFIAMFILYEEQTHWDEWLWGKLNDASVYLHKFAVTPKQIGKGLGKAILQWMETDLQYKNIEKLKLDCITSNQKLNAFYEACGYKKIGVSKGFSLFEKKLT